LGCVRQLPLYPCVVVHRWCTPTRGMAALWRFICEPRRPSAGRHACPRNAHPFCRAIRLIRKHTSIRNSMGGGCSKHSAGLNSQTGGAFLRELIFNACCHTTGKSNGRHPRRYDFKKLQRGVFGLFFPHRHGAQAIFLQREFSQRFKCARSVDAAFCTETGRKNYPIIYFCIVGKAQPVSRRTAFPAAIDGIATLGLEQLATPATSPFAHRLGRRLP
jgi:hypothetical protein